MLQTRLRFSFWHHIGNSDVMNNGDLTDNSNNPEHKSGDKDWKNPLNPEEPEDSRDEEQFTRQVNEAKRRKGNLTEKDHIDKPKKTK